MKRGKKLIILCGVLVILGACYALVQTLTVDPDSEEDTGIVLEVPASPIQLSWTDDSGTLTLAYSEDAWVYADDTAFPLDQSVAETLTTALSSVTASQVIEAADGLEDYGLDAPVLTISALDEDGAEYTFAFGDQNSMTNEYYLMYNGDEENIYLVDSTLMDAFTLDLYDMVEMENLPDFGTVTALSVEQPDGSLSLTYVEDSSALSYDTDNHWFLERNGSMLALDSSKVSTLTSAVTGLTWQSCVTYDVDDEELMAWGLNSGSATTVTAVYTYTTEDEDGEETTAEGTFVLLMGGKCDDGTYAMLEGSTMVYLISTDTADSLRYASYSSLRADAICSMDWDSVDQMDVTMDGITHTVSFDETEVETESEDGEETEVETVALYTWDGQELDSTAVEDVLSAIDALTATADASGSAEGDALITFTFHRNTGDDFADLTLEIYSWDTSSCLVIFSGEGSRLVDRSAVSDLTELLQTLFSL